jgi:hypothetical protein
MAKLDPGASSVSKAVKTFEVKEEDLATPATVFAFIHNLGTNDVVVGVFDRLGRTLKKVEITVQDENTVVVKNDFDWNHGDKIVVIG